MYDFNTWLVRLGWPHAAREGDHVRGMYFEDFEIGRTFTTSARTVTEADIVNYACLSGDFNQVHTDWEYARSTAFGGPVAHGPLVYAIAGGLNYASGVNEGTLLALLGVDEWRMLAPVFAGDTIRMHSTVADVRASSKPGRGVVVLQRDILNQRHESVQSMKVTLMYRVRPGGDEGV